MISSPIHRPTGWHAEVTARGVAEVGVALGLSLHDRPASLSPCPSCGQETRHRKSGDNRAAVNVTSNGAGWYCLQCGAKGDAPKLAAWCVLGRPARGSEDLKAVRTACAAVGLCAGAPGAPVPKVARRAAPAQVKKARPVHLPAAEVEAFWAACRPLKQDLAALGYLANRYQSHGYTADDLLKLHDVVRATPLPPFPFPPWWLEKWTPFHRVIVPAYDSRGVLHAVQARDVTDPTKLRGFAAQAKAKPKNRWPLNKDDRYHFSGLVFADRNGQAVLAGRPPAGLRRVLVVEGLTDTIRATLYARLGAGVTAVLGLESGAPAAFRDLGRRWPRLASGAPVPCVIAPDPDAQGARYLSEVREALPASVPVLEATW